MYEGHSVGVIVPAYNEAETVGTVLEHVPDYADRIFVVDDCSTDETWEIVESFAAEGSRTAVADGGSLLGSASDGASATASTGGTSDAGDRIVPIRHEENRGAGGALKTGYRRAAAAEMDLIVTLDADGQMDPAIMDRFLDPLVGRKRAFAKGDRLASGEHRAAMPGVRLFGNVLLTYLTRIASGYWHLRDPQNGYTAITHDALTAIDVDALPDHHDYCNALFAQLRVADVEVVDVPMRAIYGDEESTIDFRSFVFRTSATLARSYCWRLRRQYLTTTAGPLGRVRSAIGAGASRLLGSAEATETDGDRSAEVDGE